MYRRNIHTGERHRPTTAEERGVTLTDTAYRPLHLRISPDRHRQMHRQRGMTRCDAANGRNITYRPGETVKSTIGRVRVRDSPEVKLVDACSGKFTRQCAGNTSRKVPLRWRTGIKQEEEPPGAGQDTDGHTSGRARSGGGTGRAAGDEAGREEAGICRKTGTKRRRGRRYAYTTSRPTAFISSQSPASRSLTKGVTNTFLGRFFHHVLSPAKRNQMQGDSTKNGSTQA